MDCHSTWRTCYSDAVSLTLFADTLENPDTRAEFTLRLASFVSYRREGAGRVTMPMILARVSAF